MKPITPLGLLAYLSPLGARGLLLRWLAHLVLHCTDESQLDRNSCLQLHSWHLVLKFHATCVGTVLMCREMHLLQKVVDDLV